MFLQANIEKEFGKLGSSQNKVLCAYFLNIKYTVFTVENVTFELKDSSCATSS